MDRNTDRNTTNHEKGRGFNGTQKLGIVILVVGIIGGAYFFMQSRAATEIALTLTTNPNLERGLVGHWTFDGQDMDWASTTAQVLDRSPSGIRLQLTDTTSYKAFSGVLGQSIYQKGTWWEDITNRSANAPLELGTGERSG